MKIPSPFDVQNTNLKIRHQSQDEETVICTTRNEVGARLCVTRVCDSVHRGMVSVPGGSLSRGFSVQGGLCPGGLCPGGLCHGDSPYSNGRLVRILLECILVS